MFKFSEEQIVRYSRQIILSEVGGKGQQKLLQAKVLIVGAGGLGSPALYYLAAAGLGTLGLIDFDEVELSNLQRQIIHTIKDIGKEKVISAKEKINSLNPDTKLIVYKEKLTSENAIGIFKNYDFVIDGCDNFPTRYLVNDASFFAGKPSIYGSVFKFEGQATVFKPPHGPCYRCLYPQPPPPGLVPSCQEAGVLGVVPGIIGLIQATEAIKLILGEEETLIGRLLIYNALEMSFQEFRLRRDPNCPLCGKNPTVKELIDYEEFCQIS